MDAFPWGIGVLIAAVLLITATVLLVVTKLFRKVEQGKALIVSKMRKIDVTFTGQVVLPVLHRAEVMDISVKTIEIARTGRDGLICRDNIRADIRISFFVRVSKTAEDVIRVAQAIGTARASDKATLQELFNAKFSEALKTVGKQMDFTDLYTKREELRYRIIEVIGVDLNGYHLEDAAIDYLEQTPLSQLDANNILDAQGIRKITELTAIEHIRTNETRQHEQKEITRQNVDAREAILSWSAARRTPRSSSGGRSRRCGPARRRRPRGSWRRSGCGRRAPSSAPRNSSASSGRTRRARWRSRRRTASGSSRSRTSGSRRTASWRPSPGSGRRC